MTDAGGARAELQGSLHDVLAAVEVDGRGRTVCLTGEAGIGKSTLAAALANEARARGIGLWAASAAEPDRATPYAVLARLTNDDRERMLDVAALRRAGSGPSAVGVPIGVEAGRFDVAEMVVERFELVAQRPSLVVIEDLHWADSASLAAIGEVAEVTTTHPLLLLLSWRALPESGGDRWLSSLRRDDIIEASVPPLSEGEVELLLRELCGGRPGPALARRARGASGNPFLLREFASGLLAEQRLIEVGDEIDIVEADVPGQLRAAVAAELDRLGDATAAMVRAGAVMGGGLDVAVLSAVLDRSPFELAAEIRAATAAGLFESRSDHLAFRHDLVREAVYAEMPVAVRTAAHRRVAQVLSQRGAPAALVGSHVVMADTGGDAESIEALRLAAADTALVAPESALDFLDRARALAVDDLDTRRTIELARLEALTAAGRLPEAETAGRWLLQVVPDDARSEIRARLGGLALIAGDGATAISHLEAASDGCPSDRDRSRIMALAAMSAAANTDYDRAETLATQAVELGRRTDEPVGLSCGLALLARMSTYANSIEGGLREGATAVAIADSDPSGDAHQYIPCLHYGMTAFDAHRLDVAREMVEQGNRLAGTHRIAWSRPLYGALAAACHLRSGALDEARAEAEASVELADRLDSRQTQLWAESILTLVAIEAGEVDAAERWVASAEISWGSGRGALGIDHFVLASALVKERRDDARGALDDLAGAWDLFEATGLPFCNQLLARDLHRLARLAGDRERAGAVTAEMERAATTSGLAHLRALATWLSAIDEANGPRARSAVEQLGRVGADLEVARWLVDGAELIAGSGGPGPVLRSALEIFDRCGASGRVAEVRQRLEVIGQRTAARDVHGWGALTDAEAEIARLLAGGLTNAEIAQRRGSSRRTIESHLLRIYRKLGIEGRVKLTVAAAEHFRVA